MTDTVLGSWNDGPASERAHGVHYRNCAGAAASDHA
jgi:hypothetical protein